MLRVNVKTPGEQAQRLAALVEKLREVVENPAEITAAAEVSVATVVRDHLLEKAKVPNKLGGASTGYWRKAAESVTSDHDGEKAVVEVAHVGVALHFYGGVVKPVRTKALTIPLRAEAHGKTVQMLGGREAFVRKGGLLFLVGDEDGLPYFQLAKSATIKEDPTVLPTEDRLAQAAADAAEDLLAEILA